MNKDIELCAKNKQVKNYCQLAPTIKGWGCRFLGTPATPLPTTEEEKAELFSKVYREAKTKGVTECPYFNSLYIEHTIENL